MIQFILTVFSEASIATLSRGYGRKTSGFRHVTPESTPQEVGDEPLLFPRSGVESFVCEKRVDGWEQIQEGWPSVQLLLLDDVMQHRAILPHRLIMLTTFEEPFFQDHVLPAGRLRENRSGAARADVIVVTKCPLSISEDQRQIFLQKIKPYSQGPVFFAWENYGQPYDLWTRQATTVPNQAVGVAGLAKPQYFKRFLAECLPGSRFISFSDHHEYTEQDLETCFQVEDTVIITEKDAVKWRQFTQFSNKNVIVWPIQLQLENENEFVSLLLQWHAEYQPHS